MICHFDYYKITKQLILHNDTHTSLNHHSMHMSLYAFLFVFLIIHDGSRRILMKKIRKLSALLLSLTLLFTLIPVHALSDEESETPLQSEEIVSEDWSEEEETIVPEDVLLSEEEADDESSADETIIADEETHSENEQDAIIPPEKEEPVPEEESTQRATGAVAPEPLFSNGNPKEHQNLPKYADLPSKYDSRDLNIITSIKDQGSYGTCWAHGAAACVETYMIKNKLTDPDTGKPATTDINLSETHIAWYSYTDAYDRLNMLAGDTTTPTKNYLKIGGWHYFTAFTMMRGTGPVSESIEDLKYSNAKKEGFGDTYAFSQSSALVTDMYLIPNTYRDEVKAALMKHGAASIPYWHHDYYFNQDETAYCARFDEDYDSANHIVTLIGWDDNYSKDNFKTDYGPLHDGAWLVKGSWGTDTGDEGYYWISYEDTVLCANASAFYTAVNEGTYDNIYQYDGTLSRSKLSSTTGYMRLANVFTANTYEELKAAAIYIEGENLEYEADVWRLTEGNNPATGLHAGHVTGTFDYTGYHHVDLNPIRLAPGERYSIVFTIKGKSADENGVYFNAWFDNDYKKSNQYTTDHIQHAGVSFFQTDASQKSWSEMEDGNLRIKAYTCNTDVQTIKPVNTDIEIGKEQSIIIEGLKGSDVLGTTNYTGSLPDGMELYRGTDDIRIVGIPEKEGTYYIRYAFTLKDSKTGILEVRIRVKPEAERSSELILLKAESMVDYPLMIAGNDVEFISFEVISGNIPPGTEIDHDSHVLSGFTRKKGIYEFTLRAYDAHNNEYDHRVRAVVFSSETIDKAVIDLSHGPLYLSNDTYDSYVLPSLNSLRADGSIRISTQGSLTYLDLNQDGGNDISVRSHNDAMVLELVKPVTLLREYKFNVTESAGSAQYIRNITFLLPFKAVEAYTMDLDFHDKTMSIDEYTAHLMWPLYVMERDGQISQRNADGLVYIDLDQDGNEDLIVNIGTETVIFSAADTNNQTHYEISTTEAQQTEIADYSWSAKKIIFLMPEPIEKYGISIDNVEVTSRNRADILKNGIFSFDGINVLYVHGDYEAEARGIYNYGLDNLLIRTENDSSISSYFAAIRADRNTTISGTAALKLTSEVDCAVYASGDCVLSIVSANIEADGKWGISGPSVSALTKLRISKSAISAAGTRGAVCDFGGGIEITDCYIAKPLNGKISDDKCHIADSENVTANEVSITVEKPLPPVIFTKDSVPAVGCTLSVDIEEMAEMDDVLMEAYLSDEIAYRWYRNGSFMSSVTGDSLKLSNQSVNTDIHVTISFGPYQIRSEKIRIKANPFEDISEDRFFYVPVLWAYYHNPQVTVGTDPSHFSPDATCTRAQVVTFLWRSMGTPDVMNPLNPFIDVKEDRYFYKAVLWALEADVTKGTSADRFSPDQGCSRAQVVTFLWRTKGSPEPKTTVNPFKDVKEDRYFYKAVLWALENGITVGTSPDRFSPDATCTRGQIATFLYRAMALD